MEKEQVTGKIDELKGKAKLKQAYGDVKDTIKGADRKAGTDINDK